MSPKELAGLHGLVFQVAFGLLLTEKSLYIQSLDVPLLQLRNERVRQRVEPPKGARPLKGATPPPPPPPPPEGGVATLPTTLSAGLDCGDRGP